MIGLAQAAVASRHRVRYFAAADLVETLYRGLADNSVARVIDGLPRADLILIDELGFAPLDDVGTQLLFRLVAAAYERRSLGVASHWPFNQGASSCRSTPSRSPCQTCNGRPAASERLGFFSRCQN